MTTRWTNRLAGHQTSGHVAAATLAQVLGPVVGVSDFHHLENGRHSAEAKIGVGVLQAMGDGQQALERAFPHRFGDAL
jgi:hypothetical protein